MYDTMTMFRTVFLVAFVMIVAVMAFILLRGMWQWNRNNKSPVESVEAKVCGKRMEVSGHQTGASTWYYVTFEEENGARRELMVSGEIYGLLAEGDEGVLTYQRTRYLDFERQI